MGGRQKAVLVVGDRESAMLSRLLLSQAVWGLRRALCVSCNTRSESHDMLNMS